MSRKALLKRTPKKIEIDGEPVWIRSLTLREALRFDELAKDENKDASVRYIVSACVVDESGKPEFGGPDDPDLMDVPIEKLRAVSEQAAKQSGSGKVETLEKNLPTTN